jgi:hypothetical protein
MSTNHLLLSMRGIWREVPESARHPHQTTDFPTHRHPGMGAAWLRFFAPS